MPSNKLHNAIASIAIIAFTLIGLTGVIMMTLIILGPTLYGDLI